MNNRFFRRGQRPTFTCGCCGRSTRDVGQGGNLCSECFEIAGIDNTLNDCRRNIEDSERNSYIRTAEALLNRISSLGGNVAAVKTQNEFIWANPYFD